MSYSTPAMIRQALVPTSDGSKPADPTGTAADLTDAQLQDAIDEADSTINNFIGRFYTVPVAEVDDLVPHPIDYWSRNIAAYNATLSYRQSQDFADTDPVARRYNATMLALQSVRDGKASLSLPNLTDSRSGSASAGPAINPDAEAFTRTDALYGGIRPGVGGFQTPGEFVGHWVDNGSRLA